MKGSKDSPAHWEIIDSKQALERLRNTLEAYDLLRVPDLEDVMKQFMNKSILIYGAGCYGTAIYNTFSRYGIKVDMFLDIKAKPGDRLFDIPVYRADDKSLDTKIKEEAVVVTAIVKDHETHNGIFDFIKQCGFITIVDAQSIRCHSVFFDNKLSTDTVAEHVKKQAEDILKCFDLFSDEESRKIYLGNTMAHIKREYGSCLESVGSLQYFPDDIVFIKGYGRFIDCGGYIGDTVDQLMNLKKELQAVAVFEPNLANFSKLSAIMDTYSVKIPELYLWPCAVSEKTEILFMDYIGGSSTLNSENKDNCVQCVSLDDVLKNFAPTFLKMDVEGEERKTIIGAEKIIKRHRPDLAVCVYHCINHLWDIALLIDSWNLGYKFYLRTHNTFTMETVLYATSSHKEEGLY
jgi:FkbM family methyltransferase